MGVALGFLGLSALAAAAAGSRLAKQYQFDQKASQKAGVVSPKYPDPDFFPNPDAFYPNPDSFPDPNGLEGRESYPDPDFFPNPQK